MVVSLNKKFSLSCNKNIQLKLCTRYLYYTQHNRKLDCGNSYEDESQANPTKSIFLYSSHFYQEYTDSSLWPPLQKFIREPLYMLMSQPTIVISITQLHAADKFFQLPITKRQCQADYTDHSVQQPRNIKKSIKLKSHILSILRRSWSSMEPMQRKLLYIFSKD